MRLNHRILYIIIAISINAIVLADSSTDSLKSILQNVKGEKRIELLVELAHSFTNISIDSSNFYFLNALEEAQKIKSTYSQGTINIELAKNYYNIRDYKLARYYVYIILNSKNYKRQDEILAEARYILGNIQRRENITDSAKLNYEIAIEKYQDLDNEELLAKSLNNLGMVYAKEQKFEDAIQYYNRSLKLKKKLNLTNSVAITYYNIGNVYRNWGKYDEALVNYQEALVLFEQLENKNGIANCLQGKAIIYEALKEYETALEFYLEALSAFKEIGNEYPLAEIYNNIGILYSKIAVRDFENKYGNNWDDSTIYFDLYKSNINLLKSFEYHQMASSAREKINDLFGLTSSYNNMGTLSYNIGEYKRAITYYMKALDINEKQNNYNKVVLNKHGIAISYLKLKNYKKAKKYLNESYELALETGALESIKINYNMLSEYYELTGNFKKSLEFHKKYMEIKDSMFTQEKQKQIFELQTKYETEKKEQEIVNLNITNELNAVTINNQKNLILFFVIGFLIVVVAAILLLRLNRQIKKANIILNEKNKIISHQKDDITASIKYASKIQTAVLPPEEDIENKWLDLFILFKPRDIVSGDFYWINHFDNKSIIIAADCTGHGVPGAFMSMLGTTFLNEIILSKNIHKAGNILTELRGMVKFSLKQTGRMDEAKDGMDIALCILYKDELKLEYAGAYNPLWLYRKNEEEYELVETKADRNPIGIHHKEIENFTTNEISLKKGDTMYIFSDGYADQFGHSNKGKFKTKNLKKLLLEIQNKPLDDQKEILELKHDEWKGNHEQIDDILIIGFRV